MTGDPPVGTEDVFPKSDPDEAPEERRARLADQAPLRTAGGTVDSASRADAIARREGGVTDFSHAEDEDSAGEYQIEDYPGQDDPSSAAGMQRDNASDDSPGNIAARGFNDLVRGTEHLLDDDDDDDAEGRSRR